MSSEHGAGRRPALVGAAATLGGVLLASLALGWSSPALASATDYTWQGGGSSSDWSEGANWLGDVAPTAGASIGTLTLPLLPSFQSTENNVSGLSANQVAVTDSHGYYLMGDGLDLGSGGLSVASAAEGDVGQFYVFAPLTLSSPQTWQVTGMQDGLFQQIGFAGQLSGESSNLTINLNDPTLFTFGSRPVPGQPPNTANDELGEVSFNGTTYCTRTPLGEVDGHEAYQEICYKTEVELYAGALNADDGHALNLHDIGLYDYDTATGPIRATDSELYLRGTSIGPVTAIKSELLTREILTLSSLSLDGGSKLLQRIYSVQGTTPGVDYDQVTSTGTVSLGGATLELVSGGGECPPPHVGQVDTLISTTGSLSGQFGNAPEGGTITVAGVPGCERAYSYRINYHTSGEPQTVTATALPAVPTLGELPAITGTATEGQILSVTHGFWTNQPSGIADQWQRCDSSGGNCQPIAGATGQSYTLTASDVGSTIRVQETASNSEGSSEPAESEATTLVQAVPAGSGNGTGGGTTSSGGGSTSSSGSGSSAGAGSTVTATVSTATIRAALAHLRPTGKPATVVALLKHGGLTMPFTAPAVGSLSVQWYASPSGAKAARKIKPVLVASGKATFAAPGTGKVKVRLTAQGKRLLRHARQLRVEVRGVFTSDGEAATVASLVTI